MSSVFRVFLMNFCQLPPVIIYFLPEPYRLLRYVNLFDITCEPATPPPDFIRIAASAVGEFFPVIEFSLILSSLSFISHFIQSIYKILPQRLICAVSGSASAKVRPQRHSTIRVDNAVIFASFVIFVSSFYGFAPGESVPRVLVKAKPRDKSPG